MYEKKNLTYILTILEAIEKIFIYTESFSNADQFFEANDQMNFNACQTLLLVVGEEVKKINTDLKQEHSTIPWRLISNLRNKIAHDYRGIDPNISFDIVENYLSPLKEELLDKITRTPHYRHLKYLTK